MVTEETRICLKSSRQRTAVKGSVRAEIKAKVGSTERMKGPYVKQGRHENTI